MLDALHAHGRAGAAAGRASRTTTALPLPLRWGEYRAGGLVDGPVRAARARRPGCPRRRSPRRPWCSFRPWRSTGAGCGWAAARASTTGRCAGGPGGAAGRGGPRRRIASTRLPAEPHDVPMTHALTPGRGLVAGRLTATQHVVSRTSAIASLLLGRDPQPVGGLHLDLAGDELAAEADVGRQPDGGVAKSLVEVGLCARRPAGCAGSLAKSRRRWSSHSRAPLYQASAQRHQVVDLHGSRRCRARGRRRSTAPLYGSCSMPLCAKQVPAAPPGRRGRGAGRRRGCCSRCGRTRR